MRAQKLLLDGRGRVLLPPALREAAGLRAGEPLVIGLGEVELIVAPANTPVGPRPPTLDRKGRLTLPASLRSALGLVPGAALLAQPGLEGLRLATPARLLGRLRSARLALQRRLNEVTGAA